MLFLPIKQLKNTWLLLLVLTPSANAMFKRNRVWHSIPQTFSHINTPSLGYLGLLSHHKAWNTQKSVLQTHDQKRTFQSSSSPQSFFKNWWNYFNAASKEVSKETFKQMSQIREILCNLPRNSAPSEQNQHLIEQIIKNINTSDINKHFVCNKTPLTNCILFSCRTTHDFASKLITLLLEKGADPLFKPNFEPDSTC